MAGAYIDLKNVLVLFQDGYTEAGAVNNAAGYTAGASLMLVDAIVGVVPVGTVFTVVGDTTRYTVTSTVETTGNTTTLNFTPVLAASVADNDVITFLGRRLEITVGEGNCTYDEKKMREYKKDRGKLDQVRDGDEDPMDVNMTFAWTYLSSNSTDTTPTPEEVLKQEGPASTWLTTGGDCEPYSIDVILVNQVPTCGAEAEPWEEIRLPEFRYESLGHDPKTGLVTVQGKCNALKAVKTRYAAS